jgi:hypothetical protein
MTAADRDKMTAIMSNTSAQGNKYLIDLIDNILKDF